MTPELNWYSSSFVKLEEMISTNLLVYLVQPAEHRPKKTEKDRQLKVARELANLNFQMSTGV